MRRHFYLLVLGFMLGLLPTWGLTQTFPDRPIKVVVPFAPGNTLDNALRQVAEEFKKNTGQSIVVESKPGGSGSHHGPTRSPRQIGKPPFSSGFNVRGLRPSHTA